MKARILVVEPEEADGPPRVPNLVTVAEDGTVIVTGDFWAVPLAAEDIEDVSLDDVWNALKVPAERRTRAFLSEASETPADDLATASTLRWMREWWLDEVAELLRSGKIKDAPALRVAA